jgi:hypothetical protein
MRNLPIVSVVVVFGGIGAANVLKAPPGRSKDAAELQVRFDRFPEAIGPWKGKQVPVSEKHLRKAEAQAYLSRLYVHEQTRAAVNVLVLAGEPGALGAHDPEVCFAGSGLRSLGSPTKGVVPGTTAELWTGHYETAGVSSTEVTVSWGWFGKDVWKAPNNPRLGYSGCDLIFKLYVSRVVTAAERAAGTDPAQELIIPFLRELEPRLNRSASPAAGARP